MHTSNRNYDRTLYASERNDIDMALAGEALISQGLSMYTEPRYLELVDLIPQEPSGKYRFCISKVAEEHLKAVLLVACTPERRRERALAENVLPAHRRAADQRSQLCHARGGRVEVRTGLDRLEASDLHELVAPPFEIPVT